MTSDRTCPPALTSPRHVWKDSWVPAHSKGMRTGILPELALTALRSDGDLDQVFVDHEPIKALFHEVAQRDDVR